MGYETLALSAAAHGMENEQLRLGVIANNIANVNTTGFKRSKPEFQDLLYCNPTTLSGDPGTGDAMPTGIQVGNGSRVSSTTKVFTQGDVTQTGRSLDIAIDGDGFFELQKPDGTKVYSRDGSFKTNANGQIVNSSGYVVSGLQNIPTNQTGIFIAPTGEVTVETATGSQTFTIPLCRVPNPGGLKSLGGNLYEATASSGEAVTGNPGKDGLGLLRQNYLEMSNVNVVEEMVTMITAQRAYEMNSKTIQTESEMMSQITQMKR